MNFKRLEENILDMVLEEQLKLGYAKEAIRLYYPLASLNRFLETQADAEEMRGILREFCKQAEPRLGHMKLGRKEERFCFVLPPETAEYVHAHGEEHPFLRDFIEIMRKHGATLDEILAVFHRASDQVHVEEIRDGEFDYLVYFEDGRPDSYRYFLTNEMGHFTYHRFTEEDAEELMA